MATQSRLAQPVLPLRYSKNILPLMTSIKGLFLANIQQVYPWDREINYAVVLVKSSEISDKILKDEKKYVVGCLGNQK